MKKVILSVLFVLIGSCPVSATLVTDWNFDQETGTGPLLDSTTPATDIPATGSFPFVASTAGQTGSGLGNAGDFLTTGQYFQTTTHPELDFGTGNFTISGWLKAPNTTYATDQGFIIQNATSAGGYYVFLGRPGRSYTNKLNFQVLGGTSPLLTSDNTVTDNQWHWFAVVVNSQTMSMYIDGILQASTLIYGTGTTATSPSGTPFRIGRFYDGYLDEMKAYNEALNADAVYAQDGKTLTGGSLYDLWQVPEPATVCLLSLGMITLIRRNK